MCAYAVPTTCLHSWKTEAEIVFHFQHVSDMLWPMASKRQRRCSTEAHLNRAHQYKSQQYKVMAKSYRKTLEVNTTYQNVTYLQWDIIQP